MKLDVTRQLEKFHILHYVALQCNQCSNVTFVIWGADQFSSSGMFDYRQFPAPTTLTAPKHWPKLVGSGYVQAWNSLDSKSWDAAAAMARRTVQATVRHLNGGAGGDLYKEITSLVEAKLLPGVMAEWAHKVRVFGNIGAHPNEDDPPITEKDARDAVEFMDYFVQYAIDIPYRIAQSRERSK